ncbi:MAG: hypothetical protein QOG92_471, partial [Verrucomicrobiota bacterium]|nr:hypothetical protein [Verrucomicrobiota bacterium]
ISLIMSFLKAIDLVVIFRGTWSRPRKMRLPGDNARLIIYFYKYEEWNRIFQIS